MTAPVEDIDRALAAIGAACTARGKGEARILGVHLEGPYINAGKLGAQPPFAREAHLDEVMRFHALAPMKLITVAPEIDGHMALVRQLTKAGIRVQIGHTNGNLRRRRGRPRTRRGRLHAPVQRHARPAPPRSRHGRRSAGACRIRRDHSRPAARAPGRDPHGAALHPQTVLRDRFDRRRRHARWRVHAGPPGGPQMHGRRAPGRRHAGRQHADDGPGAAQPGGHRAVDRQMPASASRPMPPTTWAKSGAAAWRLAVTPTSWSWTAT